MNTENISKSPGYNIKCEKKEIRARIIAQRKSMTSGEKKQLDEKIFKRVCNLWSYRECQTLLCYVSTEIEVSTEELIARALASGKRVAVPRCVPDTRNMEFFLIRSFDDLSVGSYGILEPVPEKCEKLTSFEKSTCIVPALAYDKEGYRLGFGKGYYDRFLSAYDGGVVGICYESCMSDSLPHGRFDRRIKLIVTEKRLINTK